MNRTDASVPWRMRTSGAASGSMASAWAVRSRSRIERTSSAKSASLFSKYQ